MINEENLDKLYNEVLDKTELTTKQLNECGLNSKDIKDLIEDGSIKRLKRGLYSLESVDSLLDYGTRLLSLKEYEKANLCFEKCFELDPTHVGVIYQIFFKSIKKRDYQRAFKMYEALSQTENEFYNIDANYYLYLLSIITEVPEKHRDYARYLKFENIRIPSTDKRYKNIILQNKVRLAASQRRFSNATKQYLDLINENGELTLQDIIAQELLFQALHAEVYSKDKVIELIKQKKYMEVIKHLSYKEYRHNLSIMEEYILKLAEQLIEIKKSSIIPQRRIVRVKNLYDAIDTNNYSIALRLSTEYNEEKHISNDTSAINLLLNDICSLINDLSKQEEPVYNEEDNNKTEIVNKDFQSLTTFSSIVSCLLKKDFDKAFNNLSNYMELIDKVEYEFLIIDLIKISILENDNAFTKPMIALTLISRENYIFDISSYIQEFYLSLSLNKFEEAKIYLDIISKSKEIGQYCMLTGSLYEVLESSKEASNYVENNQALEDVENILDSNKKESEKNLNKYDVEKRLIAKKYEELVENKGIILLEPMDEDRINIILNIVDEYNDMVAFVINNDDKKQVVLRYKSEINEYFDERSLINAGNDAYENHNYDDCINTFLQLLQLVDETKSLNYVKLGITYMKKHDHAKAIDYLTVATALARQEHKDIDFSDLILRLKGGVEQDTIKPRIKMNQQDFDYSNIDNFYGIDNFNEINSSIMDSGLDVESACQQMNIASEKIEIIKLIYAREYYIHGNYERGDLFLNSVIKSKNKTKEITKLLEEIRRNKKFYQNRQMEDDRPLLLYSLIPKKSK